MPRLTQTAFISVIWCCFVVSTILCICRSVLRFKKFRRFFADDAFVLVAWIMLLACLSISQVFASDLLLLNQITTRQRLIPPDFMGRTGTLYISAGAFFVLYYTLLWSIKLSFLFFFRRMYIHIESWMRYWWVILFITGAAYIASIFCLPWNCMPSSKLNIGGTCTNSSHTSSNLRPTSFVAGVLDIFTDILIIAIPIAILWKIQMDFWRKVALGVTFSFTLVTIAIATTRLILIVSDDAQLDYRDLRGNFMWSMIESCTALIVTCLGSFRSLFRSNRSSKLSRDEDHLTIGHSSRPRVRRGSFAHIYGSSVLRSKDQPETIDMPSRMPSNESSVLEFLTENENIMHGRNDPGQPFEKARVVH